MQFIYLILSIYYGRKNPLFYLIFPMAMVSGPGALIDSRTVLFGVDIFTQTKNVYKDVIVVYLFLIVLYLYPRCKFSLIRKSPMGIYGIYILFLIVYTFAISGTNYDAINVMRLFTNMVLGYFLLLLVLSTASYRQFVSFVNMLLVVTAFFSVLYVLNSSKILPIFDQKIMYEEVDEGMGGFYRDFSTIPYFSNLLFLFSFAALLLKNKTFNRKALIAILITYPFVLLYTFTRGLLIGVIIELIIIIVFVAWRQPRLIFKTSTFSIALAFVIVFGAIQMIFVKEFDYYNQRMKDAKTEGTSEQNVAIRIAYHVLAYDLMSSNNSLIIGGGISKKYDQKMNSLGAWQADSTLPFLLIFTGIIGIVLYYYIGIFILITTFKSLLRYPHPLLLALFAFIAFSLIASLFTGGYHWGDPFIFFPYALVIGFNYIMMKEIKSNKLKTNNSRKI